MPCAGSAREAGLPVRTGGRARASPQSVKSGHPMYEPLVSGGTVRRLWIGEAELYGQHLLRLDAEVGAIASAARFPTSSSGGTPSPSRSAARSSMGFLSTASYAARPKLRLLEHTGDAEAALSVEKPCRAAA